MQSNICLLTLNIFRSGRSNLHVNKRRETTQTSTVTSQWQSVSHLRLGLLAARRRTVEEEFLRPRVVHRAGREKSSLGGYLRTQLWEDIDISALQHGRDDANGVILAGYQSSVVETWWRYDRLLMGNKSIELIWWEYGSVVPGAAGMSLVSSFLCVSADTTSPLELSPNIL